MPEINFVQIRVVRLEIIPSQLFLFYQQMMLLKGCIFLLAFKWKHPTINTSCCFRKTPTKRNLCCYCWSCPSTRDRCSRGHGSRCRATRSRCRRTRCSSSPRPPPVARGNENPCEVCAARQKGRHGRCCRCPPTADRLGCSYSSVAAAPWSRSQRPPSARSRSMWMLGSSKRHLGHPVKSNSAWNLNLPTSGG